MNKDEWAKLLKSYKSVKEVAEESLEGLVDHINTKCNSGKTQTVATSGAGRKGLPPFHEELVTCDRGTRGCNLIHQDGMALDFAKMSLDRIAELAE